MNDFELDGTLQTDDSTRDLILNKFKIIRCFYCGELIPDKDFYAEIKCLKTGSKAVMCAKCLFNYFNGAVENSTKVE